ncbi:prolyl 4-hydroxylase subunit alpha-1-like [Eurosta solidaginis]|uniref:prolyl 4-hydroxylase subunit alpha-1-like n=1 Tax=Eurosta solidaginis TaxID=178769 RepID=UPI00353161E4
MATKMLSIFRSYVIFFIVALHCLDTEAEYFSSIDKIQMLASVEKDLYQWFKNYTLAQAEDFAIFRNFISKVKKDHAEALEDPEAFLSNPINAFKLIKRSVDDWAQITEYVKNHTQLHALKSNLTTLENQMHLPDGKELQGAAKGLGRIQTMYNLSSNDLANGVINDLNYGTKLSAGDCFEIGANLFEAREYPLAIDWFELTLKFLKTSKNTNITESETASDVLSRISYLDADTDYKNTDFKTQKILVKDKLDESDYDYPFDEDDKFYDDDEDMPAGDMDSVYTNAAKSILSEDTTLKSTNATLATKKSDVEEKMLIDILEYLALAKYKMGKSEEAISYIQRILELNPEHAFKDMEIYMSMKKQQNDADPDSLTALQNRTWFANYTRLCQGKELQQKDFHKLSCTLDTLNHPLFILAPLKRELLLDDPEIVMYYGLLSEKQMLNILEESYLDMHRSQVGTGSHIKVRDVRISQHTWLSYNSSTLKYIYRTVSAISGYDLKNAEQMQVANYGIGGQYDPHHDYSLDSFAGFIGNRIATHLFYISDVKQGGNTVFPLLNVYSKPVKGAMLMWHNLHKSLDPDLRTLHAGCPVIVGTKRISNVWVHSGYQEFARPCDLIRDNYKSVSVAKLLA